MSDQSSPRRFVSLTGIVLSALNLVIVAAIYRKGFEGSWGGFFIFLIDLPISIPILLIDYVVRPKHPWIGILVGATWWYVVGWWVEHWVRRKLSKHAAGRGERTDS